MKQKAAPLHTFFTKRDCFTCIYFEKVAFTLKFNLFLFSAFYRRFQPVSRCIYQCLTAQIWQSGTKARDCNPGIRSSASGALLLRLSALIYRGRRTISASHRH